MAARRLQPIRRRGAAWLLVLLALLLLLSSPCRAAAVPSRTLLNTTGILHSSTSSTMLSVLDNGWSRVDLCGGDDTDCALQLRLTQLAPPPESSACSLAAVLQLACTTQTDDSNLPRQVCVTKTPSAFAAAAATDDPSDASGENILFPQDSPNFTYNETIWSGLGSLATVSGERTLRADVPSWVHNPATSLLSPAYFAAVERVALRNAAPAESDMALPVRVLLLNTLSSSCMQDVHFHVEVVVTHNAACASFAWAPESSVVVPDGMNGTKVIVIPGWSRSTPVRCDDAHATCHSVPTDARDPNNGNTTALCQCDAGFAPDPLVEGACVETAADLSMDATDAQPFPLPGSDPSDPDPAAPWKRPVSASLKGAISGVFGLQLNDSSQLGAARLHSSSSPSDAADRLTSYWYARLNISRAVQNLSLVFHVTVYPTSEPGNPLPMQLSFSPDAFPSVFVNTPLGCPNGSDLVAGSGGESDEAHWDRWDNLPLGQSSSSCWALTQQFPDSSGGNGPASLNTFKLYLHPAFLQGFLDRAGVPADGGEDASIPLFFSLFYQSVAQVDVRSWFQQDLRVRVPLCDRPDCGTKKSNNAGLKATTAARSTSPATTLSVRDPPSKFIPSEQSWVQSLLPSELVYFTLNASTPGFDPNSGGGGGSQPWWAGAELGTLVLMVNDTKCFGGAAAMGWQPPHWWHGAMTPQQAAAAGVSPTGLPPLPALPVAGGPAHMALSGGCFRANDRYSSAPSTAAGIFGVVASVCAAPLELSLWHVPPLALDTRSSLDVFVPLWLNATGAGCWRELTLSIPTSVPNDLLITVDQPDARILLREGSADPNVAPWLSYPTLSNQYNATTAYNVPNDDGGGSLAPSVWRQRRVLYADLSPTQLWYAAVYLDPFPSDGGAAHGPRAFRIRISWAKDESGFAHMSLTLRVIFGVGGAVAGLLLLVAAKLRIDKCRADAAQKAKVRRTQEKARLIAQAKHNEYARM